MTACFSILLVDHIWMHLISENIFIIGTIILSCGLLIMDASFVLEDLFGRSRISSIIKGLNSRSLWSSFGWSTKRKFSEGLALRRGRRRGRGGGEGVYLVGTCPLGASSSSAPGISYLEVILMLL